MFRKFLSCVMAAAVTMSTLMVPTIMVSAETNLDVSAEVGMPTGMEPQLEVENEYDRLDATGEYRYSVNYSGYATIESYRGSATEVVIPDKLDDYIVTGIDYKAFQWQDQLVKVTIPAGIYNIAEGAFSDNNPGLVIEVSGDNNYYKVENSALLTMDGKTLIAPSGLSENTEYTIPSGVTKIGKGAFTDNDYITKLTIPDGVTELGEYAFNLCAFTEVNIGNGITELSRGAFGYTENLKKLTIPDNVKIIGEGVFEGSSIEEIDLGNGVTTICDYAFNNSSVVSLTIPKSVTEISTIGIIGNKKLEVIDVEIGNPSYMIVERALFTQDGETLMVYPAASEEETYVVPDGVKRICNWAFYAAKNLDAVVLPDSVNYLDESCFAQCSMLKNINLPDSIVEMGDYALSSTLLSEVVLPGNLQKISTGTFYNCYNLREVFIPSGVRQIGICAFIGIEEMSLENVYFAGSKDDWDSISVGFSNDALYQANVHYLGNLKDFVDRLYNVALGRDYDMAGLNRWVYVLMKETHDGAGIVKEFILGKEFELRNLTDEEFVDTLYLTLFNREADQGGKDLWLNVLSSGYSREYVLSKFVNLDEFTLLCQSYGISRGVMFEDGSVAKPGVPQFVCRLYEQVFGRQADAEGLYTWTWALVNKAETAESVAKKFFGSDEYVLKNADSTTYVTDLYAVFMDREADAAGLNFWVACLEEQGASREWVLEEFAKSEEFKMIAAKYGL